MAEAGRPTALTEELFREIKKEVFVGGSLKDIAERCGIPVTTFYTWHSDNYLGLADKLDGWRRDKKLEQADVKIDEILALDPKEKEYTRAVADMAKFVKEALDKKNYSKRTEMTGADGSDLMPKPILVKFMDCDGSTKDNRDSAGV